VPTAAALAPVRPTEFAPEVSKADGTTGDGTTAASALQTQPPLSVVPAAAQPAPAAAPSPAAQVADAVVSHVQVSRKDGTVEFQMRLDPPDLGRVQVQLVSRGNEVHGQVIVASEAVRQVMESQLPELRQRLEAAGVNVQQFSVATDAGGGGGGRSPYPADEPAAKAGPLPAATAAARPRAAPTAGSLDVTV
jgi:flagellar hook-length control protein FliK